MTRCFLKALAGVAINIFIAAVAILSVMGAVHLVGC